MTVTQLRATMTTWEFILWAEFYDRERKAIQDMRDNQAHGSR